MCVCACVHASLWAHIRAHVCVQLGVKDLPCFCVFQNTVLLPRGQRNVFSPNKVVSRIHCCRGALSCQVGPHLVKRHQKVAWGLKPQPCGCGLHSAFPSCPIPALSLQPDWTRMPWRLRPDWADHGAGRL